MISLIFVYAAIALVFFLVEKYAPIGNEIKVLIAIVGVAVGVLYTLKTAGLIF